MIIKAPDKLPADNTSHKVFLAGSIEMGAAIDWQKPAAETLERVLGENGVTIISPRRDDWDPNAKQSIHDDYFRGQVEWELDMLEEADTILMYLAPDTKSPISLLELGLCAPWGSLVVCCPQEFWRQGNVEIMCYRYGIPLYRDMEHALRGVLERVREQ